MYRILLFSVFICYSFYGFGQSNLVVEGSVGIGIESIGKALEVYGNVLSKSSPTTGTAGSFAADGGGFVSFWVNDNYDPQNHTSGWTRTLNLREGKVGIGTTDPQYNFDVHGSSHLKGKLIVDDNVSVKGLTIESGFDEINIKGVFADIVATEYSQSEIRLRSNDDVYIYLDQDDSGEHNSFFFYNGDGNQIGRISENGTFVLFNHTDPSGSRNLLSLKDDGDLVIGGSLTQNSDINKKSQIINIDYNDILHSINEMPIYEWQYKGQGRRHIGPMAQDFHNAFGLGDDNTTIAAIDADGVALAAIQALFQRDLEKERMIINQQSEIDQLNEEIKLLKQMILTQTSSTDSED